MQSYPGRVILDRVHGLLPVCEQPPTPRRDMLKIIPNIPVTNLEDSVEFYLDVLGFEMVKIRGRGAMTRAHLRRGGAEIIFRSCDPEAPLPFPDPFLANQIILHIQVNDILALYDRIRENGVDVVQPLEPTLFGAARFMIRDLDGRLMSFDQPGSAQG